MFSTTSRDAKGGVPAADGDPVAQLAGWTPLVPGGTNFRSRRLICAPGETIEFKATPAAHGMTALFVFFGGAFVISGCIDFFAISWSAPLVKWLLGLIFSAIGAVLFLLFNAPVVFDGRARLFRKGYRHPLCRRFAPGGSAKFEEIHAVQIVAQEIRSRKGCYTSFELNLVLADGSRRNVLDHGDLEAIRHDAAAISAFLGKPVWDAA